MLRKISQQSSNVFIEKELHHDCFRESFVEFLQNSYSPDHFALSFWSLDEKSFFLCIPVEEKEGYLEKLDSDFFTIIGQILKFDELQVDILDQLDPHLWKKIDLVKEVTEVCNPTFLFHVPV